MIITFTWYSILICIGIIGLAQAAKYYLSKFNLGIYCKLLPVAILIISFIVYSAVLGKFGASALASAAAVTAVSCYTFDFVKSITGFIKELKEKIAKRG